MKAITSIHVEGGASELQDFAEIYFSEDRIIIAVADGVGGIAGGTLAAETFIYNVQEAYAQLDNADLCRRLLLQIDALLASAGDGGETTGIVVVATSTKLFDAKAGDSDARLYCDAEVKYLTDPTKPFLGSGNALVTEFATAMTGTLVVATDGLWKYAKSDDIADRVMSLAPENLASELINLPRLKSGRLPDDIAVVTCRFRA